MGEKRKFKKSKLAPTPIKKTKVAESDVLELNFWNKKVKSILSKGIKTVSMFGKKGTEKNI